MTSLGKQLGSLKDVGLIPVAVVIDQEASQRGFASHGTFYKPLTHDTIAYCRNRLLNLTLFLLVICIYYLLY